MADVRPFRALRPRNDVAHEVISPPYDVLTLDEALELARGKHHFVHVTRPEVDLPIGADAHSDEAYQKARANLDALASSGILIRDGEPTFYFYGQVMGEHRQIGILAGASVPEYLDGRIKKHEFTRPDKEDDRTHHLETLNAQVGLVFLTYRASAALKDITARVVEVPPAWTVDSEDRVRHQFWPAPAHMVPEIQAAFANIDALYVADGHHRSAAASRVHQARKDDSSKYFLAGLFPDDELHVMAYNRVVHTLNGLTPEAYLEAIQVNFTVDAGAPVRPACRGQYSMYLGKTWYSLTPRPGLVDESDAVARLDVAVLQNHLLGPILGIEDPRRSTNITFVGGIRGPEALVEAVDGGAAVAFSLFPTSLGELFAVADAGQVMPPKSTWFEPKLRGGVVVRPLD
ncbi:MAG: DUF1015 domain-containing protein [Proteobacteria bacterium]|nr:DUF1015 domain-containing protein [Pseudomonadota bacterium]